MAYLMATARKKKLSTVRLPKAVVDDFVKLLESYPPTFAASEIMAAGFLALQNLGEAERLDLLERVRVWDIQKLRGDAGVAGQAAADAGGWNPLGNRSPKRLLTSASVKHRLSFPLFSRPRSSPFTM